MGLGPIGQRRAQRRGGGGRRGRPLTPGWAPGRATPTPATLVDRRALSAPCLSRQAVASFFQGDPAGMWQNCGWNTLPAPLCPLPPRSGSHCHCKACATCMCVLKVSRVAVQTAMQTGRCARRWTSRGPDSRPGPGRDNGVSCSQLCGPACALVPSLCGSPGLSRGTTAAGWGSLPLAWPQAVSPAPPAPGSH